MNNRFLALVLAVVLTIGVGACTASDSAISDKSSSTRKSNVIIAKKSTITPTFSFSATIGTDSTFTINAPVKGVFKSNVKEGDVLKPGTIVGKLDDKKLISETDAAVLNVVASELEYPKHYPLITLVYPGYALSVELPNTFSNYVKDSELSAKFQATGKEPADISKIYLSYGSFTKDANNGTDSRNQSQKVYALFLIPKDLDLHVGDQALVVIKGEVKRNVLTLPLSCLAGRDKKALISVKASDGSFQEKTVELGASDGAMIEIVSGINEGDEVSTIPPNIDPRVK